MLADGRDTTANGTPRHGVCGHSLGLRKVKALVGMLSDDVALVVVALRPSVDDQAVFPQAVAEPLVETPGAVVLDFNGEAKNRHRAAPSLLLAGQDQRGADPLAQRSRFQRVHLGHVCEHRPHLRISGSKEQRQPADDPVPAPGEQVHRILAQLTCPALLVVTHVERRHIPSSQDFHVLDAAWPDVDAHCQQRASSRRVAAIRPLIIGSALVSIEVRTTECAA